MNVEIPKKPILVGGATGAMGQEVVRALLEQGAPVRVFVRSPEKVALLPASVERVVGDLEDAAAVRRAVQGVHAAFFVGPHDDAEEQIGANILDATNREGVRLVFGCVHADGKNRLSRYLARVMIHFLVPHYDARMRISERIRNWGENAVVLSPANYFQNDELLREQILAGTYPAAMGLLPRVDTRDIGDAAARALLDPTVKAGAYNLVGPESLTGAQIAANWSAALGRDVRYAPDAELIDRLADTFYSGRKALDAKKSMRSIAAKIKVKTSPVQLQQTVYLLGRQPRSHIEYVREMAAMWKQQAEVRGAGGTA